MPHQIPLAYRRVRVFDLDKHHRVRAGPAPQSDLLHRCMPVIIGSPLDDSGCCVAAPPSASHCCAARGQPHAMRRTAQTLTHIARGLCTAASGRKIVVGVDGSAGSSLALRLALQHSKEQDTILLLHVPQQLGFDTSRVCVTGYVCVAAAENCLTRPAQISPRS